MANDGDRGMREKVSLQMSGIVGKLAAEPTILADVEAVVDAQVSVIQVAREAKELEAAELAAKEVPVEVVKE